MEQEEARVGIDVEKESRDLVRDFLEGDRRAFDRLILLHQRSIFSLCLRLLGDYDDADDAAQEVFIRVHRYLGGFRSRSSFRTWIYRIGVNTCKSRLGSGEFRMRKKSVKVDPSGGHEGPQPSVEIPFRGEDPLGSTRRREVAGFIEDAIAMLQGSQKIVVVLKDVEGRSYEEIVEITGLKMGTVKSNLSRARLKLRELLKGKIDE